MSNVFTISAAKLLSASKVLQDDLLFLGYFFFNSYYDTLEITDIEKFGDSGQILTALDSILSSGTYYSSGYYAREFEVREKAKNRLNEAALARSSNHQLIIRISKVTIKVLGVFNHATFDIRFSPKNPKPTAVGKDYDVWNTRFNEPHHLDNDYSYIVTNGVMFDTASLGSLKPSLGGVLLPEPFSFADPETGSQLTTHRMNEYFGYLSTIGSTHGKGVIRFTQGKSYKLSPLFLEFSAEALKAGLIKAGVVRADDLKFKVHADLLERFGISFVYDEFEFPNGINIATKELFFVEGCDEPGWRVNKKYYPLEAI